MCGKEYLTVRAAPIGNLHKKVTFGDTNFAPFSSISIWAPKTREPTMSPAMRLSTKDLPAGWRTLLQWGPCFCLVLKGETCPSCANAERITAAGLDWCAEYEKAVEAGDAILF
jgi:hypothetical protein